MSSIRGLKIFIYDVFHPVKAIGSKTKGENEPGLWVHMLRSSVLLKTQVRTDYTTDLYTEIQTFHVKGVSVEYAMTRYLTLGLV